MLDRIEIIAWEKPPFIPRDLIRVVHAGPTVQLQRCDDRSRGPTSQRRPSHSTQRTRLQRTRLQWTSFAGLINQCEKCGYQFKSKAKHMQHVKSNVCEKHAQSPYVCTVCPKRSAKYRLLYYHMLTHFQDHKAFLAAFRSAYQNTKQQSEIRIHRSSPSLLTSAPISAPISSIPPPMDLCVAGPSGLHIKVPCPPPVALAASTSTERLRPRRNNHLVVEDTEMCFCDPQSNCANGCLNAAIYVECSKSNCPCFDTCENTKIQRNKTAPGIEIFETEIKGRGVKATIPLVKDLYVAEYFGKIMQEQEFERRMHRTYATRQHHYGMSIGDGWVIDAYDHPECTMRYVNHSCDPNCRVEKWTVDGIPRMAFITSRNISGGEELTIDYMFKPYKENAAQTCHCGSENCRGTISAPQKGKPQK